MGLSRHPRRSAPPSARRGARRARATNSGRLASWLKLGSGGFAASVGSRSRLAKSTTRAVFRPATACVPRSTSAPPSAGKATCPPRATATPGRKRSARQRARLRGSNPQSKPLEQSAQRIAARRGKRIASVALARKTRGHPVRHDQEHSHATFRARLRYEGLASGPSVTPTTPTGLVAPILVDTPRALAAGTA